MDERHVSDRSRGSNPAFLDDETHGRRNSLGGWQLFFAHTNRRNCGDLKARTIFTI